MSIALGQTIPASERFNALFSAAAPAASSSRSASETDLPRRMESGMQWIILRELFVDRLETKSPRATYNQNVRRVLIRFTDWGTKGACPQATHAGPFPGCHSIPVRKADKFHLTGKPTELLRELVQVVPPGSRILDPFAGSGTTLVAAQELGRLADGIEREREYCEITRGRLQPVRPAEPPRRSLPTARSLAM